MNLTLDRRYGVYRTYLKGLSVSQAEDYFQHLLDDEVLDPEGTELPTNEFCIDDTAVDISFADYIEMDLAEAPGPDQPKKAA